MRTTIILLALSLLSAPAFAGELPPANSSSPVLVMWPTGDAVYYPLPAGAELTYAATGPVKLVVEVRRRFHRASAEPTGAEVEAYGDGQLILRIKTTRGPVPGGSINDGSSAVPSEADVARFTVPAGGKVLALRAPADGPDFLVHVRRDGDSAPGVTAAIADPLDSAAAGVEEQPAAPDEDLLDEEAELAAFNDDDDDGAAAPALSESRSPARSAPEPHRGYDVVDMTRPRRTAGPVLGIGGPTRGDTALMYLGAKARIPVIDELLDAGVGVGWYRFGVDRELVVSDPFLGNYPLPVAWRTGVVPITADAIVDLPLDLGTVQPIAGAGIGLYIASRLENDERTTGTTLGTQWFAGADIDAGPGDIGVTLGWNVARRKFGNTSPDGNESRETLSAFRLDTTYQFRF